MWTRGVLPRAEWALPPTIWCPRPHRALAVFSGLGAVFRLLRWLKHFGTTVPKRTLGYEAWSEGYIAPYLSKNG